MKRDTLYLAMGEPTTPREAALASLERAASEGRVDHQVLPLLHTLNSMVDLASTSSCAGRVQLITLDEVGDKQGSIVLGKWHEPVDSGEVIRAISKYGKARNAFLMAQPFLLHVRCRDLVSAVQLWEMAHSAGLKFTTIRSVRLDEEGHPVPWGVTVEVMGTERMEVPLGGVPKDALEFLLPSWLEHASGLLERTRSRMRTFHDLLLERGRAELEKE
ncbi:MAG: hypothetical protein QCI82_07585 [Candidatus Thermoplasmatota archaeon]|nr:hypothetical protein [Candidatus Thermoplasmatota archaeon]